MLVRGQWATMVYFSFLSSVQFHFLYLEKNMSVFRSSLCCVCLKGSYIAFFFFYLFFSVLCSCLCMCKICRVTELKISHKIIYSI